MHVLSLFLIAKNVNKLFAKLVTKSSISMELYVWMKRSASPDKCYWFVIDRKAQMIRK